jgi:hypothetical protein
MANPVSSLISVNDSAMLKINMQRAYDLINLIANRAPTFQTGTERNVIGADVELRGKFAETLSLMGLDPANAIMAMRCLVHNATSQAVNVAMTLDETIEAKRSLESASRERMQAMRAYRDSNGTWPEGWSLDKYMDSEDSLAGESYVNEIARLKLNVTRLTNKARKSS